MSKHNTASLKLPEERIEDDEKVVTTRYVPLGVAAAICPWNCKTPHHPVGTNVEANIKFQSHSYFVRLSFIGYRERS